MKHMMIIELLGYYCINLRILECPGGKFIFRNSTYDKEDSSGLLRQEPGKASSLPKVCGPYMIRYVSVIRFVCHILQLLPIRFT